MNNILFLNEIPKDVERENLFNIVADYPGFVELRFIKPR